MWNDRLVEGKEWNRNANSCKIVREARELTGKKRIKDTASSLVCEEERNHRGQSHTKKDMIGIETKAAVFSAGTSPIGRMKVRLGCNLVTCAWTGQFSGGARECVLRAFVLRALVLPIKTAEVLGRDCGSRIPPVESTSDGTTENSTVAVL